MMSHKDSASPQGSFKVASDQGSDFRFIQPNTTVTILVLGLQREAPGSSRRPGGEIGQIQVVFFQPAPKLKILPRSGNLWVTGGLRAGFLGQGHPPFPLTSNYGDFLLGPCQQVASLPPPQARAHKRSPARTAPRWEPCAP